MKKFKFIWTILYNKYAIVSVVFLVYVLFIDTNNLSTQIRLSRELNRLEKERVYYQNEIKADSAALLNLMTDRKSLERFAREQYLMKRDNEDVYLILRPEKNQK